uniref:SFRICE_032058 n=1 Tax=Spodoptera frugiperda TaxID=7108 RepID=A0A2H1WU90_SPOFR
MSFKSLTANRKLLKAYPPLTSVTGDHHGVQCVNVKHARGSYSLAAFRETRRGDCRAATRACLFKSVHCKSWTD